MNTQLILGIGIGIGVMALAWLVHEQFRTIKALQVRVKNLEETARKRLPQLAQEELLDAMAALDRLTMDADLLIAIKENVRAHITNALTVGTKRENGGMK